MLMHKKNGQGCFLKKLIHTHTCVELETCMSGRGWVMAQPQSHTYIAVKNELRKRSVCTDGRLFRCIHEDVYMSVSHGKYVL